jgi:hypothetical protein
MIRNPCPWTTAGSSWQERTGSSISRDFAIVRYNEDGTLDTSFEGDGIRTLNDTIEGRGNDDIICGGAGADTLSGTISWPRAPEQAP